MKTHTKNRVNLKKLLSRDNIKQLIDSLSDGDGSPVKITCTDESIIAGHDRLEPYKFPVKCGEELIGWTSGDKKASFIAALLSYLSDIEFEKKALACETLEKYKEITLLYSIAEKITSCLDIWEIAKLVIDEARKFIPSTGASVMLLNKETGMLEIIAAYGTEYSTGIPVKPGDGIARGIFLSGNAEIINDVYNDPRYIEERQRIASIVCATMKTKNGTIGIINICSETPVNYTAEHLKLLNTLASQAASAIENARLYDELKETFFTTVHTLAETIEKRDPYTGGHTRRVMDFSLAIGKCLGLSEKEMTNLKLAAILHDIGKIGVKDSILLKEGRLTDEEFESIKMHSVYGEEILSHIRQMREVIPGVKHHHERVDGRGYPDRLKRDEIDITARIIAVADSFDAMTSDRPYRKGMRLDAAFEELKKNSGTQFDTDVVNAFFMLYKNGEIVL